MIIKKIFLRYLFSDSITLSLLGSQEGVEGLWFGDWKKNTRFYDFGAVSYFSFWGEA